MSRYIATRAIRGANALVTEAELMLNQALKEKGPDTPVSFPNTAYYIPVIGGMILDPIHFTATRDRVSAEIVLSPSSHQWFLGQMREERGDPVRLYGRQGDAIHTGGAALGPHQGPGVMQDIRPVDLVVEEVEPEGRLRLGLAVELPLEGAH